MLFKRCLIVLILRRWSISNRINHEYAELDRLATLQLLRENSLTAAAATRTLTDVQLDTAVLNSLYGDTSLTLQFWLEDHPISHSYKHLAAIQSFSAD